jgi:ribosomal-protein-alanine N-acetyltransferase
MSLVVDFKPFPVLETSRLLLREPQPEDAADIFELRSDPEVMQYIPFPIARTVADAEGLLNMMHGFQQRNERVNWVIEWKETGKVVGQIGYVNIFPEHERAEVGYALNRSWHRMGIMREALQAVLRYGFDVMKCHSIFAITDALNYASSALLKGVGFMQEGFFREDFLVKGVFRNSVYYGILKRDFDQG